MYVWDFSLYLKPIFAGTNAKKLSFVEVVKDRKKKKKE